MITNKPLHKGEPAPYLAYKRIKQLKEDLWVIQWLGDNGLIRERRFESATRGHVLACANAEAKQFKNPEFFHPVKRTKRFINRNLNKVKSWLGLLPQR